MLSSVFTYFISQWC